MSTKICVTIAESSPRKVSRKLSSALASSDFAEIRLDFLKPNQIPFCLTLVRKHLKRCICTLRPISEGGRFQGTENERISILKLVAEFEPYLLDIEYNTIKKNHGLQKYLRSASILVSWHDFKKTPSDQILRDTLQKMSKFSNNVKIVTTANTIEDAIRVLSLYKIHTRNIRLVAFSMGDLGRISRILCLQLGSPYTYVSLGKAVAPGQFSLKEIKQITDLLE
jgi:3-dehydroquinate dehydratase I